MTSKALSLAARHRVLAALGVPRSCARILAEMADELGVGAETGRDRVAD